MKLCTSFSCDVFCVMQLLASKSDHCANPQTLYWLICSAPKKENLCVWGLHYAKTTWWLKTHFVHFSILLVPSKLLLDRVKCNVTQLDKDISSVLAHKAKKEKEGNQVMVLMCSIDAFWRLEVGCYVECDTSGTAIGNSKEDVLAWFVFVKKETI